MMNLYIGYLILGRGNLYHTSINIIENNKLCIKRISIWLRHQRHGTFKKPNPIKYQHKN